AQRVKIGSAIRLVLVPHLRRHIGWCSRGKSSRGGHRVLAVAARERLDQAKVENLGEVVFQSESPQMNVGGLDVAVDHAGGMSFFQRLADLPENVDDSRRR